MSLAILFHFLCAQHVSDINISVIRSLRLCWWITTSVGLFSAKRTPPKTNRTKSSNTQRTENKPTDVVIHQHSRNLLMMDILISETFWARKKWNKLASDIKSVFHSSTICAFVGVLVISDHIAYNAGILGGKWTGDATVVNILCSVSGTNLAFACREGHLSLDGWHPSTHADM